MVQKPTVANVSETALWVAVYRAMESERPDALFNDPYAKTLAGTRGEEIVDAMPKGRQLAWPMIVRTAVMDEIIQRAVHRDGVDTVLNLAAGLDTRPYRLDLPPTLRWVEADLPDMLTYKEDHLEGEQPACALGRATVDLTDAGERRALLERVMGAAEQALVVSEGLLVYLTREQVAEVARDLQAQPAIRWWLTDLPSPRLLQMLERTWNKRLRASGAPLIFGPPEGTAFFEPHGWHEVEYRSMWEESRRLERTMRFAGFWDFVARLFPKKKQEEFRRTSGIVLLGRTESTP
jgi:methyltransferase (TIGR00027 family)